MRALAVGCCLLTLLACVAPARAHWKPQQAHHNASHAVRLAWCGKDRVWCYTARQAWQVSFCEAHWWPWAANGQFLGMFQMGSWARARYGHGQDPWSQARAAHRYWLDAGWSPWTCARFAGWSWNDGQALNA